MKIHHLKTWSKEFSASHFNAKSFEYRKNDRNFKPGDILHLEEWNPETEKYTGNILVRHVGYILFGGIHGIPEDYCIMSVNPI